MAPEDSLTTTIRHPDLGELTGRVRNHSPSVVQFRNVPYAHIPARFRQSKIVTPDPAAPAEQRDCTQDGYACPQVPQTLAAFGGKLPGEQDRQQYDEFACLNTIISVPRSVVTSSQVDPGDGVGTGGSDSNSSNTSKKRLLPVLVYVHGGAFSMGAHLGPIHDTTRMVELSVKEGQPVVIVSIHYRLNWFGFIACKDLLEEAALSHEPPCNFGLHDQRNAFLWIQRYIPGFGGDPQNITAFGESAGSASLAFHMCSTVPLFRKVILQSGTVPGNAPPVILDTKEGQYQRLLSYCGIDKDDPARLERLRQVPVERLVAAVADFDIPDWGPWAEKGFFPAAAPDYNSWVDLIGQCTWVDEVIVGDCCFEGFNFQAGLKHVTIDNLISHLDVLLGREVGARLMQAYSIQPGMDPNLFWRRIMELGGDMVFSQPMHVLAKTLAARADKTVYRYNVALRNPFPGSVFTEIQGHHFLDVLFLFMTLSERYPSDRLRRVSAGFARRWIKFANGIPPWEEYHLTHESIAIVDDHHGWTCRTRSQDMEAQRSFDGSGQRRYEAWETAAGILGTFGHDTQRVVRQLQAKSLIALAGK